ncbi:MAG: tetratricopeptide repeat protein [Cyanobacteriota bacterium]|nr:tetratricopeptide repeat protein [Cyanobacteriota bacterium]
MQLKSLGIAVTLMLATGLSFSSKGVVATPTSLQSGSTVKIGQTAIANRISGDRDRAIELERLFELGNRELEAQNYLEAIEAYDRAIKLNDNLSAIWVNRAMALSALERYEEAITSYQRGLAISPESAIAWVGLGNALDDAGHPEKALEAYREALDLDPNSEMAWFNRGVTLSRLERYTEAVAAYDRALNLNPNSERSWLDRGIALLNLGNYEEAVESLDRVMRLNPNNTQVRELLDALNGIQEARSDAAWG